MVRRMRFSNAFPILQYVRIRCGRVCVELGVCDLLASLARGRDKSSHTVLIWLQLKDGKVSLACATRGTRDRGDHPRRRVYPSGNRRPF